MEIRSQRTCRKKPVNSVEFFISLFMKRGLTFIDVMTVVPSIMRTLTIYGPVWERNIEPLNLVICFG